MLHDEYCMNIETGELLPATAAIREFYKDHSALEAWTDLWRPTGEDAPGFITPPDFTGTISK